MESLSFKSILLIIGVIIGVFFVLSFMATNLSVWFGWEPPKIVSGLFNAPQWLMGLGWVAAAYLIVSALFELPIFDLFSEQNGAAQ